MSVSLLAITVAVGLGADVRLPERVGGFAGFTIPAPTGIEQKLIDDGKDGKLDKLPLLEAAGD